MPDPTWMIYGANGYTGKLIAQQAVAEGEAPVLAGRREGAVRALAEELGLEWRAFPLGPPDRVASQLDGIDLVLHCAGPFSATSAPMVAGCLRAGAHYLDITGEIDVFEAILTHQADAARDAGVVLFPGVGFDVVPSDCLAAALAARLPSATQLELAFAPGGGSSPGTTKTMVEAAPHGGKVRRDGVIRNVPTAHRAKRIPFSDQTLKAVAIPWGDVSTAWHSTGIPNITVYLAMPGAAIATLKVLSPLAPVLGGPRTQGFLKRQVDRFVVGPDAETQSKSRTRLWGRVADDIGNAVEGTLDVKAGYAFTVDAALACTERVLAGQVAPGVWTPSRAFGADFVLELPQVTRRLP